MIPLKIFLVLLSQIETEIQFAFFVKIFPPYFVLGKSE